MKCLICGSDNLEGSAYCEDCGTKLTPIQAYAPVPAPISAPPVAAPAPAPVYTPEPNPVSAQPEAAPAPVYTPEPAAVSAPAPMAATVVCVSCGAANAAGQSFCEDCGSSLAAASPASSGMAPEMPVAAPVSAVPVAAPASATPAPPKMVVSGGVEFILDKEQMILGRNSPADGIFPEIDLTDVDVESYVSRRHGRLVQQAGVFMYEDLGSSNGSFINGNRLQPNAPIELHSGDTLRLGRTEMVFQA